MESVAWLGWRGMHSTCGPALFTLFAPFSAAGIENLGNTTVTEADFQMSPFHFRLAQYAE